MLAGEIEKYMSDPRLLQASHVGELQDLVERFPYFQSARLLLSLAAHQWDPAVYQQTLKRTAISVASRSHFFDLIQKVNTPRVSEELIAEEVPSKEKAAVEEKQIKGELDRLKAAEIAVEEMTAPQDEPAAGSVEHLEEEINKQVVAAFVEKEIIRTPDLHKHPQKHEEPGSFGDWLSFLKKNNGQPYEQIEEEVQKAKVLDKEKQGVRIEEKQQRKQKNLAIIDKIIEKNPGLIRTKEDRKFYTADSSAKESLLENEHLVTETLARIYALQGSPNKAIRAYEILSLKYPQKSAYFASLIQKLRNNQ
jgi:hypothetical protein